MKFRVSLTAALLAAGLPLMSLQAAPLQAVPAVQAGNATQATMLAAGWAGERVVAVGDHGVVLLSDDQGRQWRQARSVPLSTPLTGVSFVDARHGWAVGHWGAILSTADGGESWQVQRLSSEEDRPLFAVHFFDARQGVAVGLWSLVLTTEDGGKAWTEQPLQAPPGAKRADLNLMGLFADNHGTLYATAEHGQVLRSDDQGKNWRYLDTGYEGTLWSGASTDGGRPLADGGSVQRRRHAAAVFTSRSNAPPGMKVFTGLFACPGTRLGLAPSGPGQPAWKASRAGDSRPGLRSYVATGLGCHWGTGSGSQGSSERAEQAF